MSNIQDSLDAMGGLQFSAVIDLNMVYYTMMLYENVQNLYTIVLTWRKYRYRFILWEIMLPRMCSMIKLVCSSRTWSMFEYILVFMCQ